MNGPPRNILLEANLMPMNLMLTVIARAVCGIGELSSQFFLIEMNARGSQSTLAIEATLEGKSIFSINHNQKGSTRVDRFRFTSTSSMIITRVSSIDHSQCRYALARWDQFMSGGSK